MATNQIQILMILLGFIGLLVIIHLLRLKKWQHDQEIQILLSINMDKDDDAQRLFKAIPKWLYNRETNLLAAYLYSKNGQYDLAKEYMSNVFVPKNTIYLALLSIDILRLFLEEMKNDID